MAVELSWTGVAVRWGAVLLNHADDEKAIAALNATDERTRAATNHTEAKLARGGGIRQRSSSATTDFAGS